MLQSPDLGFAVAERGIEPTQEARFGGAELWPGAGPPGAEELRWLIAAGLEKGFLTYDEIAAALEDVGLTAVRLLRLEQLLAGCQPFLSRSHRVLRHRLLLRPS